jgi:eukaryotic-like serine/threonine-protein kinase
LSRQADRSRAPSTLTTSYVRPVRSGDVIGHYRVERDLGAGAFATVWLATDQYLDDPVAIKILADNWARHDDVRRRFIDEAKIMRRIDHPRIVRVFAVDELPSGQPMFVMTYADRGTLSDRIKDRRAQARRFGGDEVAALMVELATCLAVVHDFGIVHRDLKPSNVLFRSPRRHELDSVDGDVMLLGDFGLAKDTVAHSGFTLAAGTPAYMPPEQARATSELDHRADLYSATAIMFELLTGAAPFDASTLSDVKRTRAERVAVIGEHRADLPAGWQELIDVGLAPDPNERFQSADELAEAVAALSTQPVVTTPSFVAPAPAARLAGLRAQADDVLRRFGVGRSASIDERLRAGPSLAVVGSPADLEATRSILGDEAIAIVQLAPGDVRLGAVEVIVLGQAVATDDVADVVGESPAGPIAIVTGGDEDVDVALTHVVDVVMRRADVIAASAAIAQLDDDVRRAASAAMSASWMNIRERVEALRFDAPALAELDALRAETAGRIALPPTRRQAMRRILFEVDIADRLGLSPDASDTELLDAALTQLGEWRGYQDSGQVPFTSRTAVETVVRCLERIWSVQSGYSTS